MLGAILGNLEAILWPSFPLYLALYIGTLLDSRFGCIEASNVTLSVIRLRARFDYALNPSEFIGPSGMALTIRMNVCGLEHHDRKPCKSVCF